MDPHGNSVGLPELKFLWKRDDLSGQMCEGENC